MAKSGHDNKALLREVFGSDGPLYAANPGDHFSVDGTEFVCDYRDGSTADRFYLIKDPRFLDQYRSLCEEFQGARIVELGIAEGGSLALLALLTQPTKLVGLDLEPDPVSALADFITARGLGDRITTHHGVDQADREAVGQIVAAEMGGHPIDLVIDDASHQLDATRTSFETLFPRLRPGGLYVVEDWNQDHAFRDGIIAGLQQASAEERAQFWAEAGKDQTPAQDRPRPLCDLAVELLMARASESQQAVAEVGLGQFSLWVRRGPADLDPASFRLSDLVSDHFGYLG